MNTVAQRFSMTKTKPHQTFKLTVEVTGKVVLEVSAHSPKEARDLLEALSPEEIGEFIRLHHTKSFLEGEIQSVRRKAVRR